MGRDYKRDRHIDLNKLEWEVARQPDLFKYWGDLWAKACGKRDLLHEQVKIIRSRILENVRKNWRDLGFDKAPTDTKAEAYYRTQDEYIQAKDLWIRADADSRKLYIAMRSMEHKKDMLGIEQRLYAGEYFSTPYTEPQFDQKMERDQREETIKQLNEKRENSRLGQRLVKRSE